MRGGGDLYCDRRGETDNTNYTVKVFSLLFVSWVITTDLQSPGKQGQGGYLGLSNAEPES